MCEDEIPPCNLKIGDRAYSKKLAEMIPFTIVGIVPLMNPELLAMALGVDINEWMDAYPDNVFTYLVMGKFDKPEKNWTMDQSREIIKKYYQKTDYYDDLIKTGIFEKMAKDDFDLVKEKLYIHLPIDDVEVI
jgi:hypothetical protein